MALLKLLGDIRGSSQHHLDFPEAQSLVSAEAAEEAWSEVCRVDLRHVLGTSTGQGDRRAAGVQKVL